MANATRLLKLVPPPESFAETFEFENEIETIEPLLFMLRRFLAANLAAARSALFRREGAEAANHF